MSSPSLLLDFRGRRLQGRQPQFQFQADHQGWQVSGSTTDQGSGNPWPVVRQLLKEAGHKWPRGAAIGYVTYEAGAFIEPRALPINRGHELPYPLIRLEFFEQLEASSVPASRQPAPPLVEVPDAVERRNYYCGGVEKIKQYIAQGDIYQANLIQRFEVDCPLSAEEIYERLRSFGSAPHAALLHWPDLDVISNSPESYLALKDGIVTASPIKGTIRRGMNSEEDSQLAAALVASVKDRAENVMIVDLLRNDLGRVCEYGSVRVPTLFEVQTFPTLHHLVSTVQGQLRPDSEPLDAFLAAFPCGSITGAPKIRAMQILSELEPVPRGVSMGAVGYFGFAGNMEWNVAIRTATKIGDHVTFHAGGGIVADSVPELEYDEMRLKARALWSACQV